MPDSHEFLKENSRFQINVLLVGGFDHISNSVESRSVRGSGISQFCLYIYFGGRI
jgi:hypothetical protein